MSKDIYESSLDLIQEVIGFVCRRQRLFGPDAEDFRSSVHVRLLENDCAVLRSFRGNSSLRTYLVAVIVRLGLDYRIQKWGKWRPSAVARKLGQAAVDLETLLYRDGHPMDEAVGILKRRLQSQTSEDDLRELAYRLPDRPQRRFEGEDALQSLPSQAPTPENGLLQRQHSRDLEEAFRVLRSMLKGLEPSERTILRMHFEEQFKWKEIAKTLGMDSKRMYRIKDRALEKLKVELRNRGISDLPWSE